MTFGALRTARAEELLYKIETMAWAQLQIVSFDFAAAQTYGRLRALLEKQGKTVAETDLRIAAIAVSRGFTLVTGNVRDFRHIEELQIENWLQEVE